MLLVCLCANTTRYLKMQGAALRPINQYRASHGISGFLMIPLLVVTLHNVRDYGAFPRMPPKGNHRDSGHSLSVLFSTIKVCITSPRLLSIPHMLLFRWYLIYCILGYSYSWCTCCVLVVLIPYCYLHMWWMLQRADTLILLISSIHAHAITVPVKIPFYTYRYRGC